MTRTQHNINKVNYAGQNINRVNAVKQLRKAVNNSDKEFDDNDIIDYDDDHDYSLRFLRIGASIANSFIYIGDMLKERNDIIKEDLEYKMRLDEQLSIEGEK